MEGFVKVVYGFKSFIIFTNALSYMFNRTLNTPRSYCFLVFLTVISEQSVRSTREAYLLPYQASTIELLFESSLWVF